MNIKIHSPVIGKTTDKKDLCVPVFVKEITKKTIEIIPTMGVVFAPFDGKVIMVCDCNHTIGLLSNDRVEILIHIVLDKVIFKKEHFARLVENGDTFVKGQPLIEFDIKKIIENGHDIIVSITLTNILEEENATFYTSKNVNNDSVIIEIEKNITPLDSFLTIVQNEVLNTIKSIDKESLQKAADIIIKAKNNGNRIHVSGIGKPGHIAGYIASLMSSTGTPTYFLHGTEAVHGSCGQLIKNDIVIFISNSGETAEMKATVSAIKNNDCKLIGVTGNPNSWLAKASEVYLTAHIDLEGGPLNRAPRTSILSEIVVLQALSIILQQDSNVTLSQYIQWHPSGVLGESKDAENKC